MSGLRVIPFTAEFDGVSGELTLRGRYGRTLPERVALAQELRKVAQYADSLGGVILVTAKDALFDEDGVAAWIACVEREIPQVRVHYRESQLAMALAHDRGFRGTNSYFYGSYVPRDSQRPPS
ncbi:MAG: hypothetical protein RLZZ324_900 [Candidatus Parcubacteria bacterium]|jgi:hypothetical protein